MSTIFTTVHNVYLEKNRIFNHIENLNSERHFNLFWLWYNETLRGMEWRKNTFN